MRASSSETSWGVKNSPPDLPALEAYMFMRYSYASPNRSIWPSSTLPKSRSRMPMMIFARRSRRSSRLPPSLLLVTSTSSNRPLKSFSEGWPTLDASIALKMPSILMLSSPSRAGSFATLQNN